MAAGLLPNGSTPPSNLYPTVQVNPGTNTIANAISSNGGNHTYLLQNGTFIENFINVPSRTQFIGGGASSVTVRASASGNHVFKGGGGADFVTIWGMTIDLADGTGNAIGDNFSDLLFQNVHVQNYASAALGFEDFPIYLFATNYSPNNQTIDHCQFTQAASGSVDGTSVIATGAYRQADQSSGGAANYTNLTISNNLFDTPTDHGSQYYHCVGSAQTCSGNVFVAPNFSNGQFWYEEAGSWNGNRNGTFQTNASNTSTLTGNIVTLAPSWDFAGVVTHTLGANEHVVITGNTIHGNSSSGFVVATHGGQGCPNPSLGFAITSATIQNNAIDSGVRLVLQDCTIGQPLITSPNNGITGVPSLSASAPNPISNTSATLIGTVNANNGSNITTEGFDWGLTTSYGTSPNVGTIVQSGQYSLTLNGLTQGQQYHYRARAVNTSGTGFSSDVLFIPSNPSPNDTVVTTVGPTITDSVGNVWAITSGGQVSLNGSTAATSYTSGVVEIAYVNGVVWQENAAGDWFSFNSDGSLGIANGTTSPLPPPAVPTLTESSSNVGQTTATLNGTITSNGSQTITSDGFDWGTTTAYGTTVNATTVQSGIFSVNLTGLTTGQTYHYRARATNASGQGNSTDAQFTPPPFVQGFANTGPTDGTTVTSITVSFPSQSQGNTNVIAISYHSSTVGMAATTPVKDTMNNVYTVASPLKVSDTDSQVIYFCQSIAGTNTTNTVTVTFASGVPYISVKIAEYHGLGGIDVQGSGSSLVAGTNASISPAISTTKAGDLVIVCVTSTAGLNGTVAGFVERVSGILSSDLQDDSPGVILSSFTAPSPIISSTWIEHLVAFSLSGSLTIPSVAVSAATSIGTTIATLNGSITSAGGQGITADGFDWGTTTVYGTHINVTPPVQSGSFLSNLTALSPGTSYHYRATAQNASGIGTSGDQLFSTTSIGSNYALVNHAYTNPSSVTASTLTLAPAWSQAAGDILIVAIGYTSGSATVNTVSDTANGAYSVAIGPTVDTPGGQTQYVFYRSNIAAANSGTNTITCTFSASGLAFPDMRISEFSSTLGSAWTVNQKVGLAASSATTDTSGNMPSTTVSNALIYGAGYTSSVITAPGPGFSTIDITNTDANIHEYQVVTSIGSYSATVSDSVGGTVIMQAVAFSATIGTTAVPILIQHASSGSNSNAPDAGVGTGNPGNPFHFNFPNPSLSGNTLILEATGRVIGNPSITDNFTGTGTPNTWTFVKSSNDGNAQTSVFICIGATAGTQRLVITFSGNIFNAHFCCSEFNNVTSVVGSTSLHNTSTATISAGTLTGGIQGDLVWMCGYDTQNPNGLSANITNIASGTGMSLLSVDQFTGDFCQYGTQPTATNLTPTATLSGSTDAFNAVAVVLRAGTTGTGVPSGIRVMRVQAVTAQRPIAIQFPSGGNLIYAQTGFGNNIAPLSFPSGWSAKLSVGGGQSSYLSNAGSSPNFSVLIGGTTTGIGNCTLFFYDIANAATSPFDVTTNGLITVTGNQTNLVFGTISPTTPNGLCLITVPVFSGVVTAPSNAPQCMCDMSWYGNEAYDPDLMSNADGYAHIYNALAGTINFTWTILESSPSAGDTLQYLAVAFKAGTTDITAPSTPTGFSASTVSNSSISVNWTVPVSLVDPDNTNIQITYPVEHMGGEFPSFTQFGIGSGVVSGADSLLDSGLLHPGTQYSYQMRARDPAGNPSGYTAIFFGTTAAADLTVPTVPGTPALVSETSTGITIAWATSTDTQEPSSSLTYTLQRSTNGGAFSQIAINIPGVASGNVTYPDSGLSSLNQYSYRVQAVNPANLSGSNSSNFSTASATITTEPNPPFFVQGNASSASGVTSAVCSFNSAQTTGDGNLVVISTSSSSAINISGTVTDQAGHTYALIGGPTSAGSNPVLTQWIYFSNI